MEKPGFSNASISSPMKNSPVKEKYGKLGALYNPNNIDPRLYDSPDKVKQAGVSTNYGVQQMLEM